ncbi:hypothetical protein V1272_005858 [Bradyrhizobium sp. AZCC 1708]
MSRGLGLVARRLQEVFAKNPSLSFSTSELCHLVYGRGLIEKKHRVAVLRALRTLVRRQEAVIWFLVLQHEKTDTEWFGDRCAGRPKAARRLR